VLTNARIRLIAQGAQSGLSALSLATSASDIRIKKTRSPEFWTLRLGIREHAPVLTVTHEFAAAVEYLVTHPSQVMTLPQEDSRVTITREPAQNLRYGDEDSESPRRSEAVRQMRLQRRRRENVQRMPTDYP